jgi:hypothetical protein
MLSFSLDALERPHHNLARHSLKHPHRRSFSAIRFFIAGVKIADSNRSRLVALTIARAGRESEEEFGFADIDAARSR